MPSAPPPRPVVDAEHARHDDLRRRVPVDEPEEHVWARRHPEEREQAGGRFGSRDGADSLLDGFQTPRPPSTGGDELWHGLDERVACAGAGRATEAPEPQAEMDGAVANGEIGRGAGVVAVDASGADAAVGTRSAIPDGMSIDEDAVVGRLNGVEAAPGEVERDGIHRRVERVKIASTSKALSRPEHAKCGRVATKVRSL